MALIGTILSAFRTGALAKDGPLKRRAVPKRLFWENGELTISFKRRTTQ
jgi:hypothetical protein